MIPFAYYFVNTHLLSVFSLEIVDTHFVFCLIYGHVNTPRLVEQISFRVTSLNTILSLECFLFLLSEPIICRYNDPVIRSNEEHKL